MSGRPAGVRTSDGDRIWLKVKPPMPSPPGLDSLYGAFAGTSPGAWPGLGFASEVTVVASSTWPSDRSVGSGSVVPSSMIAWPLSTGMSRYCVSSKISSPWGSSPTGR
jgi:hypothetical protein